MLTEATFRPTYLSSFAIEFSLSPIAGRSRDRLATHLSHSAFTVSQSLWCTYYFAAHLSNDNTGIESTSLSLVHSFWVELFDQMFSIWAFSANYCSFEYFLPAVFYLSFFGHFMFIWTFQPTVSHLNSRSHLNSCSFFKLTVRFLN